jgi:hypothetical protein
MRGLKCRWPVLELAVAMLLLPALVRRIEWPVALKQQRREGQGRSKSSVRYTLISPQAYVHLRISIRYNGDERVRERKLD